ncbi:serine hydrolase domain-containing protein [Streptomyces sp. NPDC006365]|uniref:serine hydrolase domain-containing protein n=1 Tax=Streptomyces sp. NPDC006365 TaxID=3364744 RepID=UPI0036B6DA1B
MARVEGYAEDGFEAVRRVFEELVADGRETGAGLSVWRDGREVVRLNGGWADAGRNRPWQSDTLVMPYSLSKAFAALAALTAVRRGRTGLDEPVANCWTEYGRPTWCGPHLTSTPGSRCPHTRPPPRRRRPQVGRPTTATASRRWKPCCCTDFDTFLPM